MSTYKLLKPIIERGKAAGNLDIEGTMEKLDTFYAADRLTKAQYEELVALVNA